MNAEELVQSIKMVQNFEFMLDREIKTRTHLIEELTKLIQEEQMGIKAAEEKRLEMKQKREILLKVEQMTRERIKNPNQVNPVTIERLFSFGADEETQL
jgi:flagellar biosynthesis/type III secretory pathway chaperone